MNAKEQELITPLGQVTNTPLRRGAVVECTMGNGDLVKGIVAYVRMGPPDYTKPEAVSVVLETKQCMPGYSGTVFAADKVRVL